MSFINSIRTHHWLRPWRAAAAGIMAAAVMLLVVGATPQRAAAAGASSTAPSAEVLVQFRPGTSASAIDAINASLGAVEAGSIPQLGVRVVRVPAAQQASVVAAFSRRSEVAFAEANGTFRAVGTPNDPGYASEWGLSRIQAASAWDVTTGSAAISIAIVDSGIDVTHPDLSSKVISSVNFSTSATSSDVYGHGTHVAGTAAAATNNATGVAGVGYNTSLQNVKVLGDDGTGAWSAVAQGITWATDHGAKVINLSLGGTTASSTVESAVNYAWNNGVVVVAAAGNNGSSAAFYPAYYANVIAVAATDSNDLLASYSDYGSWVDIAAPGSSIYSTMKNNTYGYMSGTSMATPHVAGVASLVLAQVGTNAAARACVTGTADNIGVSGIGSGRVNAYAAVVCATQPTTGSVAGTVTDSATGAAIAGATVSVGTATTTTDTAGAYVVSGLAGGTYTLGVSASGYVSASQSASITAGATTTSNAALTKSATTTASMWFSSITFRWSGPNLRVDATVVSAAGPVVGATVGMTVARTGTISSWQFSGTTNTAGVVSFAIQKATAGTYSATATSLTAAGYTWDKTLGVTSAVTP